MDYPTNRIIESEFLILLECDIEYLINNLEYKDPNYQIPSIIIKCFKLSSSFKIGNINNTSYIQYNTFSFNHENNVYDILLKINVVRTSISINPIYYIKDL